MILGVDVSEYQGEMDWDKAKDAGAEFGYFRVGCGPDSIDDQLARNKVLAPGVFPTGGYWAFNPSWSPLEQADLFCDQLATWDWKLRPWADVELTGTAGIIDRTQALENFILRIVQRIRVMPIIYTRAVWFKDHILPHMLWNCCDLAVARYCGLPGPWADGDCVPRDWDDWLFWQWSADGNLRGPEFGAQSDSIDLDWYQGTLYGAIEKKVSTRWAVWIKGKPVANAAATGAVWKNVELEQVGEQGEWIKVAGWLQKGAIREVL